MNPAIPAAAGPAGHEPAAAPRRTPPKRKARQLAKHLRDERPDYTYLKAVPARCGSSLGIEVDRQPKKLPYVPTEEEIRRYYQAVWQARRGGDVVLIKTLLYTGGRVAELVAIRLVEVDLDACRIRITNGKGGKDLTVPFPPTFAETLALHVDARRKAGGDHLFESGWKKPYSTRGVRAMLT
jgi:integrase/recombinase XerD